MNALSIDNLKKIYRSGWRKREIPALKGISFDVGEGEIFGFLGPNGAGKTTTIKIILNLVYPTSGSIYILEKKWTDPAVKGEIGFLPENPHFYEYLTGEDMLMFLAGLFPLSYQEKRKRVGKALDAVGLTDASGLRVRNYSRGMNQKLGIAQALLNDPKILILDEPMTALDPIGRRKIRELLIALKEKGKTVFLSTHIIPDVEIMCDRVGILNGGQILSVQSIEDMLGSMAGGVEVQTEGLGEEGVKQMAAMSIRVERAGRKTIFSLKENEKERALELIRKSQGKLISLTPTKPSLEEVLIMLLKK